MSEIYCVIMAGGRGERFWPCSRENTPKQLQSLVGSETLIEQTVLRLIPLTRFENILIITNWKYADPIRRLLPQLPPENIIGEPCGRDTAPCVALAAGVIRKKAGSEKAVMMLMPADHCIHDVAALQHDLQKCTETAAAQPVLTTIGIPPTYPSQNYGYIECGKPLGDGMFEVRRFVEKPSREKAERLLAEGNFKWNSGMFIWQVDTILGLMRQFAPDLADLSDRITAAWDTPDFENTLRGQYENCRKISIDYAIMEKAPNIVMREASFDWDDIGNWTSLRNHFPADSLNNVAVGRFETVNAHDCIAFSNDPDHLTCAIDTDGLVIVHTPDVTLVCSKDSTEKIKVLLNQLREKNEMKGYL